MDEDFLDYPQSDIEYPPDENIWEKEVSADYRVILTKVASALNAI